ncbi:Phosphoglucomutase @ Phosphomannomutase [hydrothermal vent metagenome]|uniref:Phosphoglucomutase @ Phosphomannomutase n=1 Tax=hydrothermal vent metagenome TaxID=652676 RepID=A0A3B1AIG6_9ZZZZ
MAGKRKARRKNTRVKGQSIKIISVYAFMCFVVTLFFSNYISQYGLLYEAKDFRQKFLSTKAAITATLFQTKMSNYVHQLSIIAKDDALKKLLVSRKWQQIKLLEKSFLNKLPNITSIKFLPEGYAALNNKLRPSITYSCLDLVHKAEKNKTQSLFELHGLKTTQSHIGIVYPIIEKTSKKILGTIRLTLKVSLLGKWLAEVSKGSYVELVQNAGNNKLVEIAKSKTSKNRVGEAINDVKIPGSRWHLKIWLAASESEPSILNMFTFIVIIVSIIIAGLTIYLITTSFGRTIKLDLDTFMQLVAAVAKGKKNHDYKLHLKEFKEAALNVNNLASYEVMGRERDDESENIDSSSVLDDETANPLFIAEDSMTLEVLDSDAEILKNIDSKLSSSSAKMITTQGNSVNEKQATKSETTDTPADFSVSLNDETACLPKEIFKAYDIRGIVGTTLTKENIQLIGRAIGSQAISQGQSKIAFARDGRLSGPELGAALVKGLRSAGMNVIDIGMVPTPLLYFVATTATNGTGVMLTGSHNPPNYNGVKMMIGGDTLSGDAIQALHQRIIDKDFVSGEGTYDTATVNDTYLKRVTDDVKISRKLRVVIDCGNGVAGVIAPDLYRKMGCDVIELFCDVDGKFPNHHPDPSQPKNLTHLIEAVKTQKADIGFAFDGDGDRLGVVSGDGNVIWPDRLMMLFATDVLTREAGAKIIFDVKCTSNLTKHIWEKGGEPLMWKTGHSFIKAKLKESGAMLAGEMSGHIFFKERWYGFDDALYSGARLLEILSKDTRKPKVVLAAIPDMVNTPEIHLKMNEGEHHLFMEKLYDSADFGSANILMIDGIRADFEDGWGLVRASNTTPTLVFRFEGKDQAALTRIQGQFKQQVLAINPNLKIPF